MSSSSPTSRTYGRTAVHGMRDGLGSTALPRQLYRRRVDNATSVPAALPASRPFSVTVTPCDRSDRACRAAAPYVRDVWLLIAHIMKRVPFHISRMSE